MPVAPFCVATALRVCELASSHQRGVPGTYAWLSTVTVGPEVGETVSVIRYWCVYVAVYAPALVAEIVYGFDPPPVHEEKAHRSVPETDTVGSEDTVWDVVSFHQRDTPPAETSVGVPSMSTEIVLPGTFVWMSILN